jgi:hypothetical protein
MFWKGKRRNNYLVVNHGNPNVAEFEVRPGGMLVQKRNPNVNNHNSGTCSASTIRIKVKYGSSYHQIRISPHASFGTSN